MPGSTAAVVNKVTGLTLMFSCEFCKISKNTFSTEHLQTTASCGILCLSMLILFRKPKKDSFTYLLYMFEFMFFRSSHEKLFYKTDAFWYRIRCSAKSIKDFSKSCSIIFSTPMALLKINIRTIIGSNTSDSWWLFLVSLKNSF